MSAANSHPVSAPRPTRRQALLVTALAPLGLSLRAHAAPAPASATQGVTADSLLIGQAIGLQAGKNSYGAETLAGVQVALAQANAAAGVDVVAALPIGGEVTDEQLDAHVKALREAQADMMLNHGSSGVYGRLIRRVRQANLRLTLLGVNSGSTQLAESLGALAEGMVFSQVVPSPWSRKTAITRDYQAAFGQAHPGRAFSYGSLEGFITGRALVWALRQAGTEPTREGLVRAVEAAGALDLGGISVHYKPGDHAGSGFVDLALVARDGRFLQ